MQQRHRKLMVQPDEKRTATPESPEQRFVTKPGVLVVDDDHLVRVMIKLGLERIGFEVLLASNGPEAIELFQTHREEIGVVLLDIRMPGIDVIQTLDSLRELDREVPACFMSGDTGVYESDEWLQRGAAHVITKPFLLDDLANILRLMAQGVPADLPPSSRVWQG